MAFDFIGSTSEQLEQFSKATAHPAAAPSKPWTELIGWEGAVDKDGFLVGTTAEEKKEIRALTSKAVACLEKQGRAVKPAKVEKKAKVAPAAKVVKKSEKVADKPARVSKYGVHPDGTVQFVPARKIYHGWFGGKIAVVSARPEIVKSQLLGMGAASTTDVVFQ